MQVKLLNRKFSTRIFKFREICGSGGLDPPTLWLVMQLGSHKKMFKYLFKIYFGGLLCFSCINIQRKRREGNRIMRELGRLSITMWEKKPSKTATKGARTREHPKVYKETNIPIENTQKFENKGTYGWDLRERSKPKLYVIDPCEFNTFSFFSIKRITCKGGLSCITHSHKHKYREERRNFTKRSTTVQSRGQEILESLGKGKKISWWNPSSLTWDQKVKSLKRSNRRSPQWCWECYPVP